MDNCNVYGVSKIDCLECEDSYVLLTFTNNKNACLEITGLNFYKPFVTFDGFDSYNLLKAEKCTGEEVTHFLTDIDTPATDPDVIVSYEPDNDCDVY